MWLTKEIGNKKLDQLIILCVIGALLAYVIFQTRNTWELIDIVLLTIFWTGLFVRYMTLSVKTEILDDIRKKQTDDAIRFEALSYRIEQLKRELQEK